MSITAQGSLRTPPSPRRFVGPALATAVGALAFAYVVRSVGAGALLAIVRGVGASVMALVVLEAIVLALETCAAQRMSESPFRPTVRGAALAYAAAQLLPAGRVAGEFARVSQLRAEVGLGRAAHASLFLHATHVAASTTPLLALVLAGRASRPLLAVAIGVVAWNAALALALSSAPRSIHVLSAVGRRVGLPDLELAQIRGRGRAVALLLLARAVHAAQALVAVALVTGTVDANRGLVAESLQILAASAADAVPAQAGVLETSFEQLASQVAPNAASAVGVVLVLRAARLALLGPVGLAACWSSGAR